jgi:ABC-2 type transport system permease protein
MKPLISWTLRQKRTSIIWWCLGVVFFVFLTLVFYPTIRDQSAQLNKSLDGLSQTTKQLFTDTNDLFSPIGYLSSQMFYLMMPLLIGILAINQGMSLIGKDERDNTLELLLSRPVSRGRLLLGKAGAGFIIVVIVGAVGTLFAALMCRLVDLKAATPDILQAGSAVTLMALSFGALTFLLSALGRAGRSAAVAVSVVYALGGYILVSLSSSVEWLRWPAKIFPFNYYHSSQLLTGTYNWANAIYFVLVIVGCMVVSWLAFRRRDLAGN